MNKDTPFQIKIPKEKQKQFMKEFNQLNDLRSAIHFIKRYKKYVIVNRKFKKKIVNFSIKTIASLSFCGILINYVTPKINQDKDNINIDPVETNITENNSDNNVILSPVLSAKTMEEMQNNTELVNIPDITEYEIEEDSAPEYSIPNTTILFPKASNTNKDSDYKNYYKVKEKYGEYIDKISSESGIDSRIIIAMIAQENPDQIDETNVGTYGPVCVTSVHDGETYNYGHYVNGEFVNEKVTIKIDNLKPNENNNQLYENGKYGNITNADAWCIYYATVILKENYSQIYKSNENLTPEEKFPLAIAAYNHGYPDVIRNTRYSTSLYDACYSIRYDHARDVNYDDDQYLEHVLNKIPDDELYKPFTFIDNNENIITFKLERNNEIATISSESIDKNYAL